MLTPDQIDVMSREMIAKAEEYFNLEVLKCMTPEAIEIMERKEFLKVRLNKYITNAFLEGVSAALNYVAAVLQREMQKDHQEESEMLS